MCSLVNNEQHGGYRNPPVCCTSFLRMFHMLHVPILYLGEADVKHVQHGMLHVPCETWFCHVKHGFTTSVHTKLVA